MRIEAKFMSFTRRFEKQELAKTQITFFVGKGFAGINFSTLQMKQILIIKIALYSFLRVLLQQILQQIKQRV
ncbi:hypothetical protein HY772_03770 [Candidatus Woesearchaeota archaeon]|nr:hypothetical protein [Candidatus Woesearchaeota archaeon]